MFRGNAYSYGSISTVQLQKLIDAGKIDPRMLEAYSKRANKSKPRFLSLRRRAAKYDFYSLPSALWTVATRGVAAVATVGILMWGTVSLFTATTRGFEPKSTFMERPMHQQTISNYLLSSFSR